MKSVVLGLLAIAVIALSLLAIRGGGSAPGADAVREHMAAEQLALGGPVVNSVGMVLAPIPAGEFEMGSPPSDKPDRNRRDELQHTVTISQPFYLATCEVTQQQYTVVMGERPWDGRPLVREGDDYAASYVSWEDATEFCRRLSAQEGVGYRLPTEAEWEYACRAGSDTAYSFGDDAAELADYAWYADNAYADGGQYAHRVGRKSPNAWGLYDMHGNVWEWCQDWYAPYGSEEHVTDPTGPEEGRFRVWRGGGFADPAANVRSATRVSFGRANYRPEFVTGFRVVRSFD